MNDDLLHQAIRNATGTAWTFDGDLHALFDATGIPAGERNERLIDYVQRLTGNVYTASGAMDYLENNYNNSAVIPTLALGLGLSSETLDSRITFTRASIGTRVNSRGLIETKQANEPRFDYDPVTLQPRGLLVEEARTNLLLYSGDYSNAVWAKAATIEPQYLPGAGPDGGAAFRLQPKVGTGTSTGRLVQQILTTGVNGTYTYTVYAKRESVIPPGIALVVGDESGTAVNNVRANYTLATGIPSAVAVTGTWIGVAATMADAGNGWIRCSLTFTTNTPHTELRPYVFLRGFLSTDEDSGSVLLACPQFELGTFPTSYIPTAGAAVTRAADAPSISGASLSWFSASAGAFVTQFASYGHTPVAASAFPRAFELAEGTANNRIAIACTNSSAPGPQALYPYLSIRSGGVETAGLYGYVGAGVLPGVSQKVAAAYEVNNYAFVEGLRTLQTSGSGAVPVGIDRMSIGNANASGGLNALNGAVKSIAYFPTRLANARLQALSA